MEFLIPVSIGELADKLSILSIKLLRITDPAKLANVRNEMARLMPVWHNALEDTKLLEVLKPVCFELRQVNMRLWDLEEVVRVTQTNIGLAHCAVGIYTENDKRSDLKRKINALAGSSLIEEKSYETR